MLLLYVLCSLLTLLALHLYRGCEAEESEDAEHFSSTRKSSPHHCRGEVMSDFCRTRVSFLFKHTWRNTAGNSFSRAGLELDTTGNRELHFIPISSWNNNFQYLRFKNIYIAFVNYTPVASWDSVNTFGSDWRSSISLRWFFLYHLTLITTDDSNGNKNNRNTYNMFSHASEWLREFGICVTSYLYPNEISLGSKKVKHTFLSNKFHFS